MEKYFCVDCKTELTETEGWECRRCGEALCLNCDAERDGYCKSCFIENEDEIIEEYLRD